MKKISIHPAFILICLWLILFNNYFFWYILAVLLHEFGHYFMAKKLGYKVEKFTLSPYGVSLDIEGQNLKHNDEIYISLAGPLANLITIFLVTSIWWIFPAVYNITNEFVIINILIALFNLLPLYPMDGGRVFVSLFSKFIKRKKALKISIFLNLVFSILMIVLFIVSCFYDFNPTILIFPIFLLIGCLDIGKECKYEKIDIFCKKTKNFSKANIYIVSSHTKLFDIMKFEEKNKSMIFIVQFDDGRMKLLTEQKLMFLALKNDYDKELEFLYKR